MSWNFNPMAGPWLATHVWEYYDYTKDLKFLKETGYELIKSSANFTVDYLWHKPDGTYTAAPLLHRNTALSIRELHLCMQLSVKSCWMLSKRAKNWE